MYIALHTYDYFSIQVYVYIYMYIYIYVCVCVCKYTRVSAGDDTMDGTWQVDWHDVILLQIGTLAAAQSLRLKQ